MGTFRYSSEPMYISPSYRETLALVAAGWTNQAISHKLALSLNAVRKRIRRMMERARVKDRTALVVVGLRVGWLDLDEIEIDYREDV